MDLVKSVQTDDLVILKHISALFMDGRKFDLDPCFSTGKMYAGDYDFIPTYIMDKEPANEFIDKNDLLDGLPFEDNELRGIVFDPPFMFGRHGKTDENLMAKRFTMFDSWEDLENMYKTSLNEFYRVLDKKGILAFKCQDYTDSKTTLTHCFVHNWALDAGFKVRDLFILIWEGGRIWNPNLTQRHARKFHSYWMVFQK